MKELVSKDNNNLRILIDFHNRFAWEYISPKSNSTTINDIKQVIIEILKYQHHGGNSYMYECIKFEFNRDILH